MTKERHQQVVYLVFLFGYQWRQWKISAAVWLESAWRRLLHWKYKRVGVGRGGGGRVGREGLVFAHQGYMPRLILFLFISDIIKMFWSNDRNRMTYVHFWKLWSAKKKSDIGNPLWLLRNHGGGGLFWKSTLELAGMNPPSIHKILTSNECNFNH